MKYGLGRHVSKDERDAGYMLAPISMAGLPHSREWAIPGLPLNQGDTPQCVAYSAEGWLLAKPIHNKEWGTPEELYTRCQRVDGMPLPHDGSTVRAAAKVLKTAGYISAYSWASSVDAQIVPFLLGTGPVILGIDWENDMFTPDAHGFIHLGGGVAGGHAILCRGVDTRKLCSDGTHGAVQLENSWGKWGTGGHAWLALTDLVTLMERDGAECCIPHEVQK